MNYLRSLVYRSFVLGCRVYRKAFLDVRVLGRENIPKGPKIFITNHITSTDPYWVLPVFPEPVHVIIGPGYQSKALARVLDYLEQINAMPDHRHTVVDEAVKYLQRGESVYTAPEGDIQDQFQLGRFYPGAARIYRRTLAPIVPIALVAPPCSLVEFPRLAMSVEGRTYRAAFVLRGRYDIAVGEPLRPRLRDDVDEKTDDERIMSEIRQRMAELIDGVRARVPTLHGRPDAAPKAPPILTR